MITLYTIEFLNLNLSNILVILKNEKMNIPFLSKYLIIFQNLKDNDKFI